MNYYQFLFSDKKSSHWLTIHKGNPAVPILIARFERLRKDPHVRDTTLDEVAGPNPLTSEWMAAHAEEVGDDGMRSLSSESMKDLFDPDDISTNLARGRWAEEKKAAYSQLLVERQAERDAQVEAEAEASRARAAQAMGLDASPPQP